MEMETESENLSLSQLNELIVKTQKALSDLQPTLHPKGAIPFKQVGLLNTARHKEKKYKYNLVVLNTVKTSGKQVTIDMLKDVLL